MISFLMFYGNIEGQCFVLFCFVLGAVVIVFVMLLLFLSVRDSFGMVQKSVLKWENPS